MLLTYFVQRGATGPIKIGVSLYLKDRMGALRTGSAEPLHIRATVPGDQEQAMHRRFASHRLSGEWFSPAPALLEAIEEATVLVLQEHKGRGACHSCVVTSRAVRVYRPGAFTGS